MAAVERIRGNKQKVAGAGCIMGLVDRHLALAAHDRNYLKLAVMVGQHKRHGSIKRRFGNGIGGDRKLVVPDLKTIV